MKPDLSSQFAQIDLNGSKRPPSGVVRKHHMLTEVDNAKRGLPLTVANYKLRLQQLNQIEDEHLVEEFRECFVLRPILVPKPELASSGFKYQISRQQLGDCKANIKEGVGVCFIVSCYNGETKELPGIVDNVDGNCVTIYMEKECEYYNVIKLQFFAQRTTFQMEYRALELLEQSVIKKIFFADSYTGNKSLNFSSFDYFRPSVASNPEQVQAIRNIVNQTSFPAPYVLFGPPGTGKTSTLAEAIGQIYKLRPRANVLAVATSNSAANELTSRLLKIIPERDIFRFFAKSCARKMKDIVRDVLDASNLRARQIDSKIQQVGIDVQPRRVVLCTVSTAGRIMTSDIPKRHFSYIFIDECGSTKEISSLVPIIGIGVHGCEITASIVLAGDPKQLGPVISYDYLNDTSHSVSLLERIVDKGLYAKDSLTGEYDPKIITQLKDNFRSHPALLKLPNRMFYDGQLRAKASSEKTHWAVGWERLPNRNFPLIFHPVVGEIKKDESSSSMYNEQEAEQVLSYVETIMIDGICGKKLGQTSLGIITPYARQVRYLKDLLGKRGWSEIEVGSTEQYQGREKPIMLMSTVRTDSKSVGFLANTKRLNVSLTRAQALMIVVGDPETLQHNRHWAKFIKYCRHNNAMLQSVKDVSEKTVTDYYEETVSYKKTSSKNSRTDIRVQAVNTRSSVYKYYQPFDYTNANRSATHSAKMVNQTTVNTSEAIEEQKNRFFVKFLALMLVLGLLSTTLNLTGRIACCALFFLIISILREQAIQSGM